MIPPEASGEFVARMEDVLEVYHRPYDERRPLVCLDEVPVQLVGEARVPLPARPGRPARYDYEYVRHGTANLFMAFEPLIGWRSVQATGRRAALDFAEVLRWLAEDLHPDARKVVLVTDNLNTHTPGCLYEAFEPARARARGGGSGRWGSWSGRWRRGRRSGTTGPSRPAGSSRPPRPAPNSTASIRRSNSGERLGCCAPSGRPAQTWHGRETVPQRVRSAAGASRQRC